MMTDRKTIIDMFSKIGAVIDELDEVIYINDEIMFYFDEKGNLVRYITLD